MIRDTTKDEKIEQLIGPILGTDLTIHLYAQAFPGEFIDDIEYSKGSAVTGSLYHEIIAPDMVLVLRP